MINIVSPSRILIFSFVGAPRRNCYRTVRSVWSARHSRALRPPPIPSLAPRPAFIIRIPLRHRHLFNEFSPQTLNRALRRKIVRITGHDDVFVNGPDKRGNSPASLKRIAVAAMRLDNRKPDVPGIHSHMFRIANPEIDVPDLAAIHSNDSEVIVGHKSSLAISRHQLNKP